jgi:hypothetical protein
VNPLELSLAIPDVSKILEDKVCHEGIVTVIVFYLLMKSRRFRRVKREMLANIRVKESVERRKRSRNQNYALRIRTC